MYAAYYNLSGRPFQLSPDHRFFFGSRSHQKAMAYLSYGLTERDGFIVITGDIGAGKTTLVRHLLNQIDRDSFVTATVVTTQLEADDALRMVASAFGLPFQGLDKATLLRSIETFFVECHQQDKHVLLMVDEVQNMPFSALEELRMLSNMQHNEQPLFQCFLIGQPQFKKIIAHEDLEQLRQRVIASCHLEPLDEQECRTYIEHRLKMVGWADDPVIDDSAFTVIYRYSNGVPRRINTLCSRLMLHGFLEDLHHFDDQVVMNVVEELAVERGQLAPETKVPAESMTIEEPAAPPPAREAAAPDAGGDVAVEERPAPAPEAEPKPEKATKGERRSSRKAGPALRIPVPLPNPGYEDTLDALIKRVDTLKGVK
jgi:putative secretion ATPase (PEP-CTERM system associated)